MDPAGFDIGRVESSAGQRSEQAHFGGQSFGRDGSGAAVQPGMDAMLEPAPARSLSSARLVGAPVAAHSSRNRSFTSRKGRSTLPLRLASRAWQARISVPQNWAKPWAGG